MSSKDRLQVEVPVVDILDRPRGTRIRQLLYGDMVEILGEAEGHADIRALRDGYRGVIRLDRLGEAADPTHRVVSLATHLYTASDIKSPEVATLSFGARVTVLDQSARFSRTKTGHYIPNVHLAPAKAKFRDPAAVAELFLGTPYLWGGNSRLGIDCSGLVQAACVACGVPCPGDSGDQSRQVGEPVGEGGGLQRGDLLFWPGHVAMMASGTMMIHANAYHMAVAFEGFEEGIARIAAQGDGELIAHRRIALD
jgi:cell wall-associated NlpC family hydrolase